MLAIFLLKNLARELKVGKPEEEKEIFLKLTKYVQGREYSPERDLFTHVRDVDQKVGILCEGELSLVSGHMTASSPSLGFGERRVSSRLSSKYRDSVLTRYTKNQVLNFEELTAVAHSKSPALMKEGGGGRLKLMNTNEQCKARLLLITKADYVKIKRVSPSLTKALPHGRGLHQL